MNVIPGQFVANGHDYRKDLARFTSLAYDLPVDEDASSGSNECCAKRELQWAERRLVSEQFAQAQAQLTEQLTKWGVHDESASTHAAPRPSPESASSTSAARPQITRQRQRRRASGLRVHRDGHARPEPGAQNGPRGGLRREVTSGHEPAARTNERNPMSDNPLLDTLLEMTAASVDRVDFSDEALMLVRSPPWSQSTPHQPRTCSTSAPPPAPP